jgi:glycerol-3-phosphate acyltransferase
MPRVMVERFVKEHLRADEVIGSELVFNRFGLATGFVQSDSITMVFERVAKVLNNEAPTLGMARLSTTTSSNHSFYKLCKVTITI